MLNNLGIIFAFSNEQFEQQKSPGVDYVRAGSGMLVPRQNVKVFIGLHDKIIGQTKADFKENVPMDDYISYELSNHEAYYTWDVSDAFEVVKRYYPDCSEEDMWRVFKKNNRN